MNRHCSKCGAKIIIVDYDYVNDPDNVSTGIDDNGNKEYDTYEFIDSWHECPNGCKNIILYSLEDYRRKFNG